MDTFGLCDLGDFVQRVECGVVYCMAFADNLVISLFRLPDHMQINNVESDRMAEPCTNRCEVPICDSDGSDKLARPVRNIEAAQAQGGAEQTEGTAASVLARVNRELGLTLVTDEIVYLVDTYLGAQVTDAGVVCNPMGAALMMFAQVNSEH
ncbi:phosphoribosylformylglycinamidine synthase [Coemansia sp. RSA 2706]|nr:phosphoribosylformylglycinamidine synthase [Coemansia sp. RSA 2706]